MNQAAPQLQSKGQDHGQGPDQDQPSPLNPGSGATQAVDEQQGHYTDRAAQALSVARGAAASRCIDNADVAASKFSFALSDIRKNEVGSTALPRLASITLDDFVGNSRTAADICAHSTNAQSDRARIEHSLAELNGMFADDMRAMDELRIQPSSFMPGAEQMQSTIQRDLHAMHTEFERHQAATQATQGVNNTALDEMRPGQVTSDRQRHYG